MKDITQLAAPYGNPRETVDIANRYQIASPFVIGLISMYLSLRGREATLELLDDMLELLKEKERRLKFYESSH